MKKFQTSLVAIGLLAAAGASHADTCGVAGNLVANCGFESAVTVVDGSGNLVSSGFTSWALSGADAAAGLEGGLFGVEQGTDPDGNNPHGGSNQAWFGDLVSNSTTLTQNMSTVATATYLVSFWLAQDVAPPDTSAEDINQVVATFGGQSLTLKQVPVQGYTYESFLVEAAGTSTNLSISLGDGTGYMLLDDISVTNVPEPASWALVGIALVGVGGLSRKRKA